MALLRPISTKKQSRITTNASTSDIAIYGNKIVWSNIVWSDDQNQSAKSDIYMYDLSTKKESQITTSGSTRSPAINGNTVVWMDSPNSLGYCDIYMGTLK